MAKTGKRKKGGIKIAAEPPAAKSPKIQNEPPEFHGGLIAWRFNAADKAGKFAWSNLVGTEEYHTVMEKLVGYETMRQDQFAPAGCHFIDTSKLSKEAKERLVELDLDDLDRVYSFRISGRVRVFGVWRKDYVRVLWYDPEHEVCVSKKKHT